MLLSLFLKNSFIFWLYIGIISVTNILSIAENIPIKINKYVIATYNICNSIINLYIVCMMFPYISNNLGIKTIGDNKLHKYLYWHYLTKYLDFCDTIIMILQHKWRQVHLLQLFHHSTIGVLWKIVLTEIVPGTVPATYAFGAFLNSFIHTIMYFHYFITTNGYKNPFKKYLTNMQIIQFVIVAIHSIYIWFNIPTLKALSVYQLEYMLCMLSLFYYQLYYIPIKSKKKLLSQKNEENINKKYININGIIRNITSFSKIHPGGNIIDKFELNNISDATDAFNNFHHGSERSVKTLNTIPIVSIEQNPKSKTKFQLMVESWKDKNYYSGGKLTFIIWSLSVIAGTVLGFYLGQNCIFTGGIITGLFWGQAGFIQHHAGHLGFTGIPRIDFTIQALFESFLKGGSGRWWRNRHNKHHAMPNSIEHDGDLRTTPFFAWDDILIKKVPTIFLRIQHLLFIPSLALYVPVLIFSVYSFIIKNKHWDEIGLISIHFYIFSNFFINISSMIQFYLIGYIVQGIYLGCMFGINHYTQKRIEPKHNLDWAEWQITSTCNWGGGSKFAQYISGFLNLQIEHHLATKMPPENYHLIVPDIKKYCKDHNLKYVNLSFCSAFKNMIKGLYDTGYKEYNNRINNKHK